MSYSNTIFRPPGDQSVIQAECNKPDEEHSLIVDVSSFLLNDTKGTCREICNRNQSVQNDRYVGSLQRMV